MEHAESYSGSAGVRTENRAERQADVQNDPNTFGHAAQDVTRDAKKRGQEVLGKVTDEAQTFVGRLRGEATLALGEGKTQLAAQIGGVARALHASSREFRNDSLAGLADLSEGLAEEVEAVETYLDDRSSESLVADFRTFAGRNRGLFIGSLFAAGLLAVRFAQSTPRAAQQSTAQRGTTEQGSSSRTTVITKNRVKTYRTGSS